MQLTVFFFLDWQWHWREPRHCKISSGSCPPCAIWSLARRLRVRYGGIFEGMDFFIGYYNIKISLALLCSSLCLAIYRYDETWFVSIPPNIPFSVIFSFRKKNTFPLWMGQIRVLWSYKKWWETRSKSGFYELKYEYMKIVYSISI